MSCAVNSLLIPIQLCGGKKTKHPRYNNVSRVFLSFSLAFNTFPITAIIESEIFSNISPQGERINKKVNPFLKKKVQQGVCMPRSLAQGRGNMKCVLVRNANMNARGRENR